MRLTKMAGDVRLAPRDRDRLATRGGGDSMTFDIDYALQVLPIILRAALTTLIATGLGMALALLLGMGFALAAWSRWPALRALLGGRRNVPARYAAAGAALFHLLRPTALWRRHQRSCDGDRGSRPAHTRLIWRRSIDQALRAFPRDSGTPPPHSACRVGAPGSASSCLRHYRG